MYFKDFIVLSNFSFKLLVISAGLTQFAIQPVIADDVFIPGALFGKVYNQNYGIKVKKSPESLGDYQDTYGRTPAQQMQNTPGVYSNDGTGNLTLEELNKIKHFQASKKEEKRQKHKTQYLHRKSFGNHKKIEASEI